MSKISNQTYYPAVTPADGDFVIGTDVSDSSATKTFLFSDIKTYVASELSVTNVLSGSSTSNQEPSGTDTALQVEFGAAQKTDTDPVKLAVDGTITFNTAGLYLFNGYGNFERQGSSGGLSVILFRALINDTQSGIIKAVELESPNVMVPYETTIPISATAGDTLKWQIMRDSSGTGAGANQGGLYTHANSGPWDDVPSASVNIWKIG